MKNLLVVSATVLAFVGLPQLASATNYNLHVGGVCSTQFSATLGQWSGETSIDVYVDQRNSIVTATTHMKNALDQYCTGNNWCWVFTYSNGGATISRALSVYNTNWNIAYAGNSASNEGGSEIGGTGWVGEIFGGCYLAGHCGPGDNRPAWNHNDTNSVTMYQAGGYKCMFPWLQCAILPGEDDGAVAYHSAAGLIDTYSVDYMCYQRQYHWTNHYTAFTCDGFYDTHTGMKRKFICQVGGC